MRNHKVAVMYMKKLTILLIFFTMSTSSFSKDEWDNNVLRFLYFDDLKTWVSGGKSLFDWSAFSDRSKLLSKETFAPHAMYHEFDKNVYAASSKYNNIPVQLNGVVYSVKSGKNGDPIVTFSAGYADQFEASGFDIEDVAELNRGQQYKFVCYKFTYDGFTLKSKNCTTLNKYYDLISLEIFNEIEVKRLNALRSSSDINNRAIEVFVKNIPQDKLKNFYEACNQASVEDVACRSRLTGVVGGLNLSNKKAP